MSLARAGYGRSVGSVTSGTARSNNRGGGVAWCGMVWHGVCTFGKHKVQHDKQK